MKKRFGIVAALLCLLVAATFIACSGGETPSGDPDHVHQYVEVTATDSTCITHGYNAHYKCSDCGKLFMKDGEEYTETTLADLEKPLASHRFNGIVITTQPNKTAYSLGGVFDPTGLVVTKTCSVDGCNGEIVPTSELLFIYENEKNSFEAGMTKITVKVGDFTADIAITVDSRVAVPVIASKTYTGETLTADVPESEYYDVTTNDGGEDAGEYDVVLTLKSGDYEWAAENNAEISGTVATVKFTITKADNEVTVFTVNGTTCGVAPEVAQLETAWGSYDKDSDVTYTYYKDGAEIEVSEISAGGVAFR